MQFSSFDDEEDGEHSGIGQVEIANRLATQCDFFFLTAPFDKVQQVILNRL